MDALCDAPPSTGGFDSCLDGVNAAIDSDSAGLGPSVVAARSDAGALWSVRDAEVASSAALSTAIEFVLGSLAFRSPIIVFP
jgi:hypothetical protein